MSGLRGRQEDVQAPLMAAATGWAYEKWLDRTGRIAKLVIIPNKETVPLSQDQKLRMTHQRQVIFEEVRKDPSHPTADEIYERVRKRLPRISLGTVYRNLDILSSCGLISRIQPGLPQMRFDGNTQEHYHMTCVECGRIEDASIGSKDGLLEGLESALGHLTKYGIFGHRLEFFGLCPDCLKKGKELFQDEEDSWKSKPAR